VKLGMKPLAALRSATSVDAKLFGVDDKLGTLEPGKLADIILLDGDPLEGYWNWLKTKVTIKGGKVVVDARKP